MKNLEHDVKLSNEIVEGQKIELEDKEFTKTLLTSQTKKAEKKLENSKAQYKRDLEVTRETINVLTKANNELKEKIKTKEAYVSALTEELNGDDDDEYSSEREEIEVTADVHNAEVTPRVTMNHKNTLQKCLACDKVFKTSGNLEKHLRDRHTDVNCQMCDKQLTNKKEVEEHMCLDSQVIPQKCEKVYCQKEFISTAALQKHIKSSHFGNQRSVCKECGEILSINKHMKKHIESCGKDVEKRNEVCKHWKRGHCNMGNQCLFSHVGHQNAPREKSNTTQNTTVICRNGPSCSFLARGKCIFKHYNTNNHYSRPQGRDQQRQDGGRQRCRFGANCDRVKNCPNLHSDQDIPQYSKKQGFRKTNQNNSRNNNRNRA